MYMYISTLAAILLLGTAVLSSPIPDPDPNCSTDRSILKSCKELTLDQDKHTLKASCQDCSGSWSPTSLDLNIILGNTNGKFTWGGIDFSKSARDTALDGQTSILTATLDTGFEKEDEPGNVEVEDKINLSEKIQNEGGSLKFV
ncbi:MAG: CVNH domain-containing protein [Linnemannia gamsii]|nr:MAG: CVNH domain-containing protein [Linnemannia gamsii]